MRILLDTHALIWFFLGDARLPPRSRDVISAPDNEIFASAASAWEIATKFRLGKLADAAALANGFEIVVAEQGFVELPITARHARLSGSIALANADPFDRILVAQAVIEQMALVSNERPFDTVGIHRIWT